MSSPTSAHGMRAMIVALCMFAAFALGVGLWWLPGSQLTKPSRAAAPEQQESAKSDRSAAARAAPIHSDEPLATRSDVRPPRSHASPGPEGTDPAWETLLRDTQATWDFVAMVCSAPEHVDPARLFRHCDLNPSDSYLPPDQRSELIALVERTQVEMQSMVLRRNHVRSAEVQGARTRGVGTKVESDRGSSVIPPEFVAGGSIMITNLGSGEGWVVPETELPVSTAAATAIEQRGGKLGAAIVDWFVSAGALDESGRTTLLDAIRAYLAERATRR